MNACSPICLVDLVPALRWSKPADVDPFLRHPRLAEAWWDSLPVTRAVEVVGATWLANNLTRLLTQQWEHLPLRDLLPPLRSASSGELAAEPVHSAVIATAGDWQRVLDTPLATVTTWAFPSNCDAIAVLSTAVLRAVEPYADGPAALPLGPSPSPGLIVEAVRTIANWMPESSPPHVHEALSYLASATGAEPVHGGAAATHVAAEGGAALGPGDTVPDGHGHAASRALRTLRALRAHRDQRDQQDREAQATASTSGSPEAPLIGPDGALRRPDFGPPRARRAYVEPRDNQPEVTVPTPLPPPPTNLTERPLIATVDQLFRGWEPLERTVAAERLFPAEPVSIRVLAGRVGVDVDRIRSAQRTAEERIVRWLSSPGGTAVTQHLLAVAERIGTAATLDHLIAAHPEHPVEIPALGAPLWRVVVALFTDRRMHDGWLIAGDPHQLRWHTRELLSGQPSVEEAGSRLGQQLGIRPQALRAWLLSVPGVTVTGEQVLLDARPGTQPPSPPLGVAPRVPGMAEETGATTANGLPIRRRGGAAAEETPTSAPAGVAESARCFRAPDGRWWHRVDVTADHLNGAPVTVPTGYAAHLGLNPGQLLCLTAPGADLLVLVWRDQPAFDSLRPLLRRLSAQPGDRIFIIIDGDQLDARRLASGEVVEDGPTGKALHLLGYTAAATPEAALEIIGHRICPDGAQPSTDAATVLEMLERRGDSDIVAELRPALYVPAHLTR
ncbi:hypothetical protein J4H86_26330 [Spiractinospora alimapuensis]|uniref:hypothetical protein n=1 Tax=Spiractinospora alimapuensis TaxID=2820884 RepID=UPI001F2E8845|nr:hypothetical protein [Spiractinospora alimapuensis]QVQ52174.1 hypothetical protein J4H86_26330 [Spiractinospora alimapuensis]